MTKSFAQGVQGYPVQQRGWSGHAKKIKYLRVNGLPGMNTSGNPMILAPFEAASLMMEIVFWTLPSRSSHTLTKYELIAASIHAGNNVRFSLDCCDLEHGRIGIGRRESDRHFGFFGSVRMRVPGKDGYSGHRAFPFIPACNSSYVGSENRVSIQDKVGTQGAEKRLPHTKLTH